MNTLNPVEVKTLTNLWTQATALAEARLGEYARATGQRTPVPGEYVTWSLEEGDLRGAWSDRWNEDHYVEMGLEILGLDDEIFAVHCAELAAAREAAQQARAEKGTAAKAAETEARERAEYLRLQAKFGTEGTPA